MIEGRHYQNAYVTRDLDKAVAAFTATADVRSIVQGEFSNDVRTPAGPGTQTSKFAFIWVGDVQYEFIQPVHEVVPVFTEMLPPHDGLAFHHNCFRVQDWADFRHRLEMQPYPVVMEGSTTSGLEWAYVDTRALLGHYLEFTCMSDQAWERSGGR